MKNPFKHGGNTREVAHLFNIKDEIIDFSANINPLGLPESIKMIIHENINNILHYPDPNYEDLKNSILKYLNYKKNNSGDNSPKLSQDKKVSAENIILGNGSSELIYLIAYALRPKHALLLSPTFSEYERALSNVNSKIDYLLLDENENFDIPLNEIITRLDKIDIIFLCNPNNPTGRIIYKNNLLYLIDKLHKSKTLLVLDEAFIDIEENNSVADIAHQNNNLFILRSLTKFFSMPGLRLGYGIGTEELIDTLQKFKQPWTINNFAESVGSKFIHDREFIKKSKYILQKEKNFLYESLLGIEGLNPYDSHTNFIFIKIKAPISSGKLQEQLIKKRILIRDCSNFRGLDESFIRIAVKNRDDNMRLIKELQNILSVK